MIPFYLMGKLRLQRYFLLPLLVPPLSLPSRIQPVPAGCAWCSRQQCVSDCISASYFSPSHDQVKIRERPRRQWRSLCLVYIWRRFRTVLSIRALLWLVFQPPLIPTSGDSGYQPPASIYWVPPVLSMPAGSGSHVRLRRTLNGSLRPR